MRTSVSAPLAACLTAGVALWMTHASLDLFPGAPGGVRVAMLPSGAELIGLILLTAIAGFLIWKLSGGHQAKRSPDRWLPVVALAALILPYVPWLPDAVPVLRTLAGPGRWLVWAVVLGQLAVLTLPHRRIAVGATAVCAISLAAFGAGAIRLTGSIFPGGDEPHYLVMTQSLLSDHDLKIENNHRRGDYQAYFRQELEPHYRARGIDGEIYSIHPIGLSILIAPAFALAGYPGAVALLIALASLAATILWRWVRGLTGASGAASFAWASVALGAPFFFNAFAIYPEVPAALAVLLVLASNNATSEGLGRWWVRGVALAALPWLSTKYLPMAGVLALISLARIWLPGWSTSSAPQPSSAGARFARTLAAILPFAVSLVGWLAFFYVYWGTLSPTAPYGDSSEMRLSTLAAGAPGLFLDQEYGVLPYAPVLVLAFLGLAGMLRSRSAGAIRALEIILTVGALLGTVGAYALWWGGSAAPGRPLVSGLLLLGVPIGWQYARSASTVERESYHLLLLVSLAITGTLLLAESGFLIVNGRDGSSSLLQWLSPGWHLWALAPSFTYHQPAVATVHTVILLGLFLAGAWLLRRAPNTPVGIAALIASTSALVLVVAASLALPVLLRARLQPDVQLDARSRVPMLDTFDATVRPWAVVFNPLSRIAPDRIPVLMRLLALPGLRRTPQPRAVFMNARFAVPAGEYEVRLHPRRGADAVPLGGALGLHVGRLGPPMEAWPVSSPPGTSWQHRFVLPLDAQFLGFTASPELQASTARLELVPRRIVDAGRRMSTPPVLSAAAYRSVAVFFHDEAVYAEATGFWTRGRSTSRVTMVAAEPTIEAVTLKLHTEWKATSVTLETPVWSQTLELAPRLYREVQVPTAGRGALIPLRITAGDGFVPATLMPGNQDRRLLGCWVEVVK